ncbi:MAG: ABC transporter substrate-binding protein, partial [Candidatus Aminicenantes bacterium]|nr:ABC transporter substrate-binding protein [Candidatus Aminicenantes bacterium]
MKLREISLAVIVIILLSINIYSERVISLSPAITEILFELGFGDLIVGNTKFCNYPPQSNAIKKIGGYLDINMEMIIDLQPDVIFHYPEHSLRLKKLKEITRLVQVSHKNITDMLNSIKTISLELKSEHIGEALIHRVKKKLNEIRN